MSDNPQDTKAPLLPSTQPVFSSFKRSPRQLIRDALKAGALHASGFYSDTTSRILGYRDLFSKKDHNIIENSKKQVNIKNKK